LHFSCFYVLYVLCYFERIQKYPVTTEDQFGGSLGLHRQFYVGVTFREIQTRENRTFESVHGENRRSRCGTDALSLSSHRITKTTRQIKNLSERQLVTPIWRATAVPLWRIWALELHIDEESAFWAFDMHQAIPGLSSRHMLVPTLWRGACHDLHLPRPGVKNKNITFHYFIQTNVRDFVGPACAGSGLTK